MTVTSRIATTALLATLVATGCGASAEEKAAACWAQREAILAEIATLETWDRKSFEKAYKTGFNQPGISAVRSRLYRSMPDC